MAAGGLKSQPYSKHSGRVEMAKTLLYTKLYTIKDNICTHPGSSQRISIPEHRALGQTNYTLTSRPGCPHSASPFLIIMATNLLQFTKYTNQLLYSELFNYTMLELQFSLCFQI